MSHTKTKVSVSAFNKTEHTEGVSPEIRVSVKQVAQWATIADLRSSIMLKTP